MSTPHTATPWRFVAGADNLPGRDQSCTLGAIKGGHCDEHVARVWNDSDFPQGNAEFIVRAVNAHDVLVKALRGYVNCRGPQSEQAWAIIESDALAALAAAGETP